MKQLYFVLSTTLLFLFARQTAYTLPSEPSLSLDEKIGQLFIAPFIIPSDKNTAFMSRSPYKLTAEEIRDLIEKYHIGGIIFLGSSDPESQKNITAEFQRVSTTPLFIAQDLEWGLAMRHTDVIRFPRALTLAALPVHKKPMIYQMSHEIGKQCHAIGVNFNLGPVADVNVHPKNPIIGMRAFGDTPEQVTELATLYMKGLLDAGILTCAKHFPGHGDTHVDSHHQLPVISHDRTRLNTLELVPFQSLIQNQIPAVMTAHLHIPALDPDPSSIATLSPAIITSLLRNDLKFKGLILTDGLGMKAITQSFTPAQAAVAAIKAGCDILLCALDIPASHAAIKEAVSAGVISLEELDAHVERILTAKQWLHTHTPATRYTLADMHAPEIRTLARALYRSALTLCWGTLRAYNPQQKVHVLILNKSECPCATILKNTHSNVSIHAIQTLEECKKITADIMPEDAVILCLYPQPRSPLLELSGKKNEDPLSCSECIEEVMQRTAHTTALIFDTPYRVEECKKAHTCLIAYEDTQDAHEAAADALLGTLIPEGHLPINCPTA